MGYGRVSFAYEVNWQSEFRSWRKAVRNVADKLLALSFHLVCSLLYLRDFVFGAETASLGTSIMLIALSTVVLFPVITITYVLSRALTIFEGGMYNVYEQNIRSYPQPPMPKEIVHKPVIVPSPANDFLITNANPLLFEDDQNDFGGLGRDDAGESVVLSPGDYIDETSQVRDSDKYFKDVIVDNVSKFKWLIPNVIAAGAHPLFFSFETTNLQAFKTAGFKAILSAAEEPIPTSRVDGFKYYFMPTEDGKCCDLNAAVDWIDKMVEQGNAVFVHCFSGMGASAAILAAYLIRNCHLTAEQAIAHIRLNYNEHAIETKPQATAIHNFALMNG